MRSRSPARIHQGTGHVHCWMGVALLATIGLVGCTGRGSLKEKPPCPDPVTEAFDPVWEPELRFDATTATWAPEDGGSVATVSDGDVAFEGRGLSTTSLYLNRGYAYQFTGTLTSDVDTTVSLVQTTEAQSTSTQATWEVLAGETIAIDETFTDEHTGAFTVSVNLPTEGTARLALQVTGDQWADDPDVVGAGPLLVGFLMHIEDSGTLSADVVNWTRRAAVVEAVSKTLQAHGAVLTLQPGESFVEGAFNFDPDWVAARTAEGMAWSVHVHNEADGVEELERSVRNSVQNYKDVGVDVDDVNGGFQLGIWSDLAGAGLHSLSGFKNPETQLDLARPHVQPWRPADGTSASDEEAFGVHDPDGPLVFLPGSGIREEDNARFAEFARRHLAQVRGHTRSDEVNTWYFMQHVDGYGPDPLTDAFDDYIADGLDDDMALLDAALTDVIDPLVASGEVEYSDPERMREAFRNWEKACEVE